MQKPKILFQFGKDFNFFDFKKQYSKNKMFVVPNMVSFIRDVSEYGNVGAIKKKLLQLNLFQISKLSWLNKSQALKLMSKDFSEGILFLIQIEFMKILENKPSGIILSDQVFDLSLALNNTNLIKRFSMLVKQINLPLSIITNNFSKAVEKLSQIKLTPDFIYTPINRYGYEMNPNKKDVELNLNRVDSERLIAISPTLDKNDQKYLQSKKINKVLLGWFES